jgi:hypothetical protein
MRIVYYDHEAGEGPQTGFRSGVAGFVVLTAGGTLETEPRVQIGPNSLAALHGHGVIEALNRLPDVEGPIGSGVDAVIHAGALDDASRVLYDADRKTYGASYEFVAERDESIEYRVAIDNREYQRTLSRLQYLVTMASRLGHAAWMRL